MCGTCRPDPRAVAAAGGLAKLLEDLLRQFPEQVAKLIEDDEDTAVGEGTRLLAQMRRLAEEFKASLATPPALCTTPLPPLKGMPLVHAANMLVGAVTM